MKQNTTHSVLDRLQSLGDGVRLRLLRLVEGQELSVGEIAKVVQLPQSTVSRHLKTLVDGGWLVRRQEGTASLFCMVPDDLSRESRTLWAAVREQVDGASEDARRLRSVLAERRTDSQTFFGKVAGEWDEVRRGLFGGRFTAVSLLSLIRRDWVVADLGCGTGNAAELLAPVVERVVAVDFSEPMLGAAKQRLSGAANVEFVKGSVEATGLRDASVDAVVCVLVLHHLSEPVNALREMRRVLRNGRGGGVALVVDMVAHGREEYRRLMGHKHLGFSREGMLGMMREAGFVDGEYHELSGEPEAKGPGLFAAVGRVEIANRKEQIAN